jgi:hypothetical protein
MSRRPSTTQSGHPRDAGSLNLAAKHALLELAVPEPPGTVVIAGRMAACLGAFVQRDRTAVKDALAKSIDRLPHGDGGALLRVFGRLGDLDVLWDLVDDAVVERLDAVVAAVRPSGMFENGLTDDEVSTLSLAGIGAARAWIPTLVMKFESLPSYAQGLVMAHRVVPQFVRYVAGVLRDANDFRTAEQITRNVVVPYASLLSKEQLADVLDAWVENDQCRIASGMPPLSVDFYLATRHLRPGDLPIWRGFIDAVRKHEDATSHYTYTKLEELLPGWIRLQFLEPWPDPLSVGWCGRRGRGCRCRRRVRGVGRASVRR